MNYKIENNCIVLEFLANNEGKFRFKKREKNTDFGKSFSTRKEKFDNNTYLEWQIGYDVPINEIETKSTKLTKKSFIGSNGKEKYPYELSEIFFEAIQLNLINQNEIENLIKNIESFESFIDENPISIEHKSKVILNNITFQETVIKLPTFFCFCSDGTQIEIFIQKQQYATGVQPMIYFCIPFKCFRNTHLLINKSSQRGDILEYEVNKDNKENLVLLFKIFGMASKRHKNDVIEILKILKH